MIDMKIGDYHIASNKYELEVMKDTCNPKTGKPTKIGLSVGHYPNLKHALNGIRRNMLRTGDKSITNFAELKQANKDIEKMFDNYLNDRVGEDCWSLNTLLQAH